MFGFLNINKPAGLTSHDVVARVRRLAGRKVKVGHAGTLDPAATGVLPVALGAATRLIPYLVDATKTYRAVVQLGVQTTTDDAEGEPLPETAGPVPPLEHTAMEAVLAPFRGTITQIPPMYSALHHQGKRLYELAREGQTVERTPREVTIAQLDLLSCDPGAAQLVLLVVCSKGTYIRSLARDIGTSLGCGGHLAALERTAVGPFQVEQATPLAALLDAPDTLPHAVLPPETAVQDWPRVTLDTAQVQQVQHGQAVRLPGQEHAGDYVRAHEPEQGRLLALLRRQGAGFWHPERVFQMT